MQTDFLRKKSDQQLLGQKFVISDNDLVII